MKKRLRKPNPVKTSYDTTKIVNLAINGNIPKKRLMELVKNQICDFSPEEVGCIYDAYHESK